MLNPDYEENKRTNRDHVATPRWVVENIYDIIGIQNYKNIWFPFNNYDSHFKLKADELSLKYKATHIFDDLGDDFFTTIPPKNCELLISNPPFSQVREFIRYLISIKTNFIIIVSDVLRYSIKKRKNRFWNQFIFWKRYTKILSARWKYKSNSLWVDSGFSR